MAGDPPGHLYWIAFGPLALIITLAAFHSACTPGPIWQRVFGFVVGAAIAAPFLWKTRTLVIKAVKHFRLMRNRCMNCGYSFEGSSTAICPECGQDPVEWSETHSAQKRSD